MHTDIDLSGKRILVVEDDYLLATDICRDLRELGATVLGPAPTPFYALSLLGRRGVDGAVLDVRLHGTDVFEVADELTGRGIPFVFATGVGDEAIPARYQDAPHISKPFERIDLVHLVRSLTHIEQADPAPRPFAVAQAIIPDGSIDDRLMRAATRAVRLAHT